MEGVPKRPAPTWLALVIMMLGPAAACAQAPAETPAGCPARERLAVPDAVGDATFVRMGRALIAVPARGRRLYRTRGCAGRFHPVPAPVELAGATAHPVGDAVVVTAPAGVFLYRRGRARALAAGPSPSASVAAHGDALFFVERDGRAGILDARRGRVEALPAHAGLATAGDRVLALDDARAFALGGLTTDLVFDRASGGWTEIASPPPLEAPAVIPTDGGVVLIGGQGSRRLVTAHAYDAATDAWRALPLPEVSPGSVQRTWRAAGRVVIELAHGSSRWALLLDPASGSFEAVDGAERGGRPVSAGGPVHVGVQAPSPQPGNYPAATVDPSAGVWRHAPLPELPREATVVFHRGSLWIVRPARAVPGGWRSEGCEGPRPPGAPGCDPVQVPSGVRRSPATLSIVPLRWR